MFSLRTTVAKAAAFPGKLTAAINRKEDFDVEAVTSNEGVSARHVQAVPAGFWTKSSIDIGENPWPTENRPLTTKLKHVIVACRKVRDAVAHARETGGPVQIYLGPSKNGPPHSFRPWPSLVDEIKIAMYRAAVEEDRTDVFQQAPLLKEWLLDPDRTFVIEDEGDLLVKLHLGSETLHKFETILLNTDKGKGSLKGLKKGFEEWSGGAYSGAVGIRTWDRFNPAVALPEVYFDSHDARYKTNLARVVLGLVRCIALGHTAADYRTVKGSRLAADRHTVLQQSVLRYYCMLAPMHARVLANIGNAVSLVNVRTARDFCKILTGMSSEVETAVTKKGQYKPALVELLEAAKKYPAQDVHIPEPPPLDLETLKETEWYQFARSIETDDNPFALAVAASGEWRENLDRYEATEDPDEEADLLRHLQGHADAQRQAGQRAGGCQGLGCPAGEKFIVSDLYLSAYAPDGDERYLCVGCGSAAAFGKFLGLPLALYRAQEEDGVSRKSGYWVRGACMTQLLALVQHCQGPYCDNGRPVCVIAPRKFLGFGGNISAVSACCYGRLLVVYDAAVEALADKEPPVVLAPPPSRMPEGTCPECQKCLHNFRYIREILPADESGVNIICRDCLFAKVRARGGEVVLPAQAKHRMLSKAAKRQVLQVLTGNKEQRLERLRRLAWTVVAPSYLPVHKLLSFALHGTPRTAIGYATAVQAAKDIVSEHARLLAAAAEDENDGATFDEIEQDEAPSTVPAATSSSLPVASSSRPVASSSRPAGSSSRPAASLSMGSSSAVPAASSSRPLGSSSAVPAASSSRPMASSSRQVPRRAPSSSPPTSPLSSPPPSPPPTFKGKGKARAPPPPEPSFKGKGKARAPPPEPSTKGKSKADAIVIDDSDDEFDEFEFDDLDDADYADIIGSHPALRSPPPRKHRRDSDIESEVTRVSRRPRAYARDDEEEAEQLRLAIEASKADW